MLVAIVTAVFFLGWQVLPLVYGEREKKILPSLSSPSPPFSHSSFSGLLPSEQAALEPENGRRRTRNEWTDERTDQQRRRARRHFDSPPPFPFPDLVKFSLLSDEGGKERGGILPSPFLSRYVEKEAFFSSFGLAASPPRSRSAADCFSFGTPLLKSESRRSRNMAAWRRADWEKE